MRDGVWRAYIVVERSLLGLSQHLRPLPANHSCSSMPIPDDSTPIFMLVLLTNLLVLLERLQRFPLKTRPEGTDSHEGNILASTPVVCLTDKAEAKRCKKRSREIRRGQTQVGPECSDVEAKAGRLCDDLAAASFDLPDATFSTCNQLPSRSRQVIVLQ
jgi:hypothetical protein